MKGGVTRPETVTSTLLRPSLDLVERRTGDDDPERHFVPLVYIFGDSFRVGSCRTGRRG